MPKARVSNEEETSIVHDSLFEKINFYHRPHIRGKILFNNNKKIR